MWLLVGSFLEELRFELILEEDTWLSNVSDYSRLGWSAWEGGRYLPMVTLKKR